MREDSEELKSLYRARFNSDVEYRMRVWTVLVRQFFQAFVKSADSVLDLGCGYGQFINNITCACKYAMDLNPAVSAYLGPGVTFFEQDCCERWPLADASLDVVFASNFLEHLASKHAISLALDEARRCLKPGGTLIALGPNIRFVKGRYWDFWDHHVPLTETSLEEFLKAREFRVELALDRFLPYTMVQARRYPTWVLSAYLRVPWAWRWFGKQFLVVAAKGGGPASGGQRG